MIEYVFGFDSEDCQKEGYKGFSSKYENEPAMISAENQRWDRKTIKQLKDEYGVIYNGGIHAYMVVGDREHPLVVTGYEDDGTITFPRQYGQFEHVFSPYWIPSIIKDLQMTERYLKEVEAKGE